MRRLPILAGMLAGFIVFWFSAPPPAFAAWPHSPASGVNVTNWVKDQRNAVLCSDDAGGAIVAWSDNRTLADDSDVYVQRLDQAGRPQWAPGGVLLCAQPNGQFPIAVVPDMQGGAIIVWLDYRNATVTGADLYAGRVDTQGNLLWGPSGVAVSAATGDQGASQNASVASDGQGGVVVAWVDTRNATTSPDIYGQWLNASGLNLWSTNGRGICTATGSQYAVSIDVRPGGDMVAAWQDDRNLATTGWDIYAQLVSPTGSTRWISQGAPACNAATNQVRPTVRFRSNGDVFVAFEDGRGGTNAEDIYMAGLRYLDGNPLYTANGWAVCTAAGGQQYAELVSDSAGGMIVFWSDRRVFANGYKLFAQRYEANNVPLWTTNGVEICPGLGEQWLVEAVPDAAGGVVAVFVDERHVHNEVYAQRLSRTGAIQWAPTGVAVSSHPTATAGSPSAASDGRGGAIVVWDRAIDANVLRQDVLALRVDEWGVLGGEPVVASVRDVPNDQGGAVRVSWAASPLDTDPLFRDVTDYLVFRSATGGALARARSSGRLKAMQHLDRLTVGDLLGQPLGARTLYWELVGSQAAYHLPSYSLSVPTPGDSMAGSNPWSAFMVMARRGTSGWWVSEPDSGYSTDDLAPPAPAPFTGQFANGATQLAWGASSAPDLAGYRVHRGATPAFEPSPANLAAELTERTWTDPLPTPSIYKLVAVDVHGNTSPPAVLVPAGVLDTGPPDELRTRLGGLSPNPLRSSARGRIDFRLAAPGHVRLEAFDLLGRRVGVIVEGHLGAGSHRAEWNGRDSGGERLAPGVYLLRLEAAGSTERRSVLLLD